MSEELDWPPATPINLAAPRESVWAPRGCVAILDTNVLISVRLSRADHLAATREYWHLAGRTYDSFTSPAILEEVEEVLVRPERPFGYPRAFTRLWLDAFVRRSRQVDSNQIPGDYAAALGGDQKDNHVLKTALAVNLHEEGQAAIEAARPPLGRFIVSADHHFPPGQTVYGWTFIHPTAFWYLLQSIE